jgi:hypothetical protein
MTTPHSKNWVARKDPGPGNSPSDWVVGTDDPDDAIDCIAVCSAENASLIESAPKLLDALKELLAFAEDYSGPRVEAKRKLARAAIAKAEGVNEYA